MLLSIHFFSIFFIVSCMAKVTYASESNVVNDSYTKATKMLDQQVYHDVADRITLYCGVHFGADKSIVLQDGFIVTKYKARAKKVEWEHIVPAENFGKTFKEWRDGHPDCRDKEGNYFKGRNCATKTNLEYRYMQSDMYNLYPAIGAVNAMRSNYNFQMLSNAKPAFGVCDMKFVDRKVEPPARARGQIARSYKYMQSAYPRYKMSRQQQQLMDAWDTQYPVEQWECTRSKRIEKLQGNSNKYLKILCIRSGLW